MALPLRMAKNSEVKCYGIFLCDYGGAAGPGIWQGSPCMEIHRDHCVMLPRESLHCVWGPQNVDGARTMGYLPRRVIHRDWYGPKGKKYVAVSRAGRLGPWKLFDIRSRVSGSGVCPA